MVRSLWRPVASSLVEGARLLSFAGLRQASRAQVIGAIPAEKPSPLLEVAFDKLITGRLAGFVGVRFGAGGASGGETVLGGGSTATGDLRLELTSDARHMVDPDR
jgi:hypothetical protein